MAWMKQARKNAPEGSTPTLLVRMNGQGEESMGEWFAIVRQGDFKTLVRSHLAR